MKSIGIVGAGIMARGMVQNFLKHGYEVHLWNRTKANVQAELEASAIWQGAPRAVAEAADIVIECVSDDEASRQVWSDPETGILAGSSLGKVYIASSSLSLDWTDELARLCQQRSLNFLDMPLTGSRPGAEGGTLKLLVGGDEAVLNSIREELGAIADKIYYFGPSGNGMRFKLILNILIGIQVNAAAQAIELARKAGLDVKKVHEALFDAPMGPASSTTNLVFTNMNTPPDTVNFALQWIEKDLRYAQAMAKQYGVDFDLLNDTQADFARAKEKGFGDQDQVKIINLYR